LKYDTRKQFLLYSKFTNQQKSTIMKRNMGTIDKAVRINIAAIIAVLYFTNVISGTVGIVLLVLAGVFVLTSLISFCPLYTIIGLNTCSKKKE
jgi:hypothetical protein